MGEVFIYGNLPGWPILGSSVGFDQMPRGLADRGRRGITLGGFDRVSLAKHQCIIHYAVRLI